jgi:hypothetical protein
MRFGGSANGISVVNNLYVAPNLVTGDYGTAVLNINQNDLSSFDQISRNVWANAQTTSWANGGINWLSTGSSREGYKTPSQWNAYGQVNSDLFSNVSLGSNSAPSSSSAAANVGNRYAGVFTDFFGKSRPSSSVTAGAVQI